MREFEFEMALCAAIEGNTEDTIVSRQLGGAIEGRRILDIVTIAPGPAFDARTSITPHAIPIAAIEADVGPGRMRYWKECFDGHPAQARAAIDRAVEIGFFERERRRGRTTVRQTVRYPDWYGTIRAIENKPDLTRPGELSAQLRTDVSLGVCDEIVLATASHVTGAHLNRLPPEVGVWEFDPATGVRTVVREPQRLPTTTGIEPLEHHPGRTDIAIVEPDSLTRQRTRIAERAYEKGWRVPFPACPDVTNVERFGVGGIPYCTRKERIVRPADACREHTVDHTVDIDAIRAKHSPWSPETTVSPTTQSSLTRFYQQ